MNLFIDINAILGIAHVPDALIPVSKAEWLELNDVYPEHCYGDPDSVHERSTYGNVPQTISAYRVDITSMFGLTCLKEANLVLKDQWLAIAALPEMRPFCKGGESKGFLAKKADAEITEPSVYDNWISVIHFNCGPETDEFGRRAALREHVLRDWKDDNRSAKEFTECEKYAIGKGDVLLCKEKGSEILVLVDITYE